MIYISSLFICTFLVFLDQYLKLLISTNLSLNQSIKIIEDFFYITNVRNTGAAWSMFEGQFIMFYIVSAIALIIFIYLFMIANKRNILEQLSILLMISGTIGNLIDRIKLGYVVDFLDFYIFKYNFPVFNLADCFLTVGAFIYLLFVFIGKKDASN